jgi:creatinine amidohydrolase/Fe(II)-dependent formamide hydrolase-like protein
LDIAGSKSLAFDEAAKRWLDIAERMNTLGIRKFVMLNAHGGNSPLLTIVATEARVPTVSQSWRPNLPIRRFTHSLRFYKLALYVATSRCVFI